MDQTPHPDPTQADRDPDFGSLLGTHARSLSSLGVTAQQSQRLSEFLTVLWAHNRNINLFSRTMTAQTLVDAHLMDSLIALPHLPFSKLIADLGSGGGFPAIPIAICRPETRVLMFEKSPLKGRFLAGLNELCPNAHWAGPLGKVQNQRGLPKTKSNNQGGFIPPDCDWVTARAFKPIPVILEMTRAYAESGGRYILYKGRQAKIREECANAKLPEGDVRLVKLYPVGDADERHLVFIKRAPQKPRNRKQA